MYTQFIKCTVYMHVYIAYLLDEDGSPDSSRICSRSDNWPVYIYTYIHVLCTYIYMYSIFVCFHTQVNIKYDIR